MMASDHGKRENMVIFLYRASKDNADFSYLYDTFCNNFISVEVSMT